MPELPEVHALAADLGSRLVGRVVDRLDVVSFAALKTFDPPASTLHGGTVHSVGRHGKFLDVTVALASTEAAGASDTNAAHRAEAAGTSDTNAAHGAGVGGASGTSAAGGAEAAGASGTSAARGAELGGAEAGGASGTGAAGGAGAGGAGAGGADGVVHLVMHLARAGWVRWRDGAPPPPTGRPSGKNPLAARLVLDDGSGFDVTEAGTKKILAIYLVREPDEVPGIARLGPDPFEADFTEEVFAAILAGAGRSQIKGVLRNQALIAGIGNAYSDEILHVARMSPFKPASMTPEEVSALYEALRSTLSDAVARSEGLAASELKREKKSNLRVHGRTGEPCPVCGDTVRQVTYADSSLQYCPTCQTGGKPLADRVLSRLLK